MGKRRIEVVVDVPEEQGTNLLVCPALGWCTLAMTRVAGHKPEGGRDLQVGLGEPAAGAFESHGQRRDDVIARVRRAPAQSSAMTIAVVN